MRLLIEAANATVAIKNGRIVQPTGKFEHVIRSTAEVRPGLINAHDHLHRNHYGRLGAPPYANAREWASDIQSRHAREIARGQLVSRRHSLLAGAWKNLLAGVTHVVHHDSWEPDFDAAFPIKVVKIASADSITNDPGFKPPAAAPFALHVAEGLDASAADEVRALDSRGILNSNLIAVHAVGPDADGIERLRGCGCAVVWCPTSNHFLFSRTMPSVLLRDGIDVLIGSDSLLTGAGTLLDELHFARGQISDGRLLGALGGVAARRLHIAAPSISPCTHADLVLLRRPVLDANLDDVILVAVGGQLRVLDPDLLPLTGIGGGQIITWRSTTRWISENSPVIL